MASVNPDQTSLHVNEDVKDNEMCQEGRQNDAESLYNLLITSGLNTNKPNEFQSSISKFLKDQ